MLEVFNFGFWFERIVAVKGSGASEERCSQVVGESFSPVDSYLYGINSVFGGFRLRRVKIEDDL